MEELGPNDYRYIIELISKEYDFEELNDVKESDNENESIQIKTTKKGVFKSNDGTLGIICNFVDHQILKPSIAALLKNRFSIDQSYEGEKYFLCLQNSKVHSYAIDKYLTVNSLIGEISTEFDIILKEVKIGLDPDSDFHILIFETNIADFLISGLLYDNQEEEERVILSNKLESSQPFFEFKAPIHFDWNKLIGDKDRQFERICELLLQKELNITSIIPIGKTRAADRGRDFEVVEEKGGFNSQNKVKWLVQCKFSEKSISPTSIAGWIERMVEHKYDGYWLMTNNDITPNLFDQFKDVENNDDYKNKTKLWQRSDFHIKLNVHSELFTNNDIFKIK